jgi:hypothetical protein
MQADVLDAALATIPDLQTVFDPFVGSGTTLVESVRRQLSFDGIDINPLAILICRSKLLSVNPSRLRTCAEALAERVRNDRSRKIDVNFPGRDKWFTPLSTVHLSRIRRAIEAEPRKQVRQLFWVVLSESVRQTSLSRETTYKLHIRSVDEAEHGPATLGRFLQLLTDACGRYEVHSRSHSPRWNDRDKVRLFCRDAREASRVGGPKAQLLLTSPPYGDNLSTITYGQFSYLALSWIPARDLEGDLSLLRSAYATDTASLGGSSRDAADRGQSVVAALPSLERFLRRLSKLGRPDFESKAASFAADFFDAVGAALTRLDRGGVAVWTLGERSVGGLRLPLIDICREASEFFGAEPVAEIRRHIQSKRTPHRNSQGATMLTESMLVTSKL